MPILGEEVSLFPETLLEAPTSAESDRRWWAVYTKARQEKSLARDLLNYEVPFYLPQVTRQLSYRGRRIKSLLPLFTGYLFLYGTDEERVRALTTNRVSQLLPVTDQEHLRRDLKQVYRLIASRAPLTVEDQMTPGRLVRVKRGALMGLEGTILQRRNSCRLTVVVHFLNRGVSLNIEDIDVELLT
jgi:transcriptional antiterminator RfaH